MTKLARAMALALLPVLGVGLAASASAAPTQLSLLASFSGTNGGGPESNLVDVNGMLYGTTAEGGVNGDGNVFAYDPATGALTSLASLGGMGGMDGFGPVAGLRTRK